MENCYIRQRSFSEELVSLWFAKKASKTEAHFDSSHRILDTAPIKNVFAKNARCRIEQLPQYTPFILHKNY